MTRQRFKKAMRARRLRSRYKSTTPKSSISADFQALIQTIRDEGIANRTEEQKEDGSKTWREWATIILLAGSLLAVLLQLKEMIKVYEPIKEQAEASVTQAGVAKKQAEVSDKMANIALEQASDAKKSTELSTRSFVAAQRAWVGPTNATLSQEPKAGESLKVAISYQNTGREPATNFTYNVELFTVSTTDYLHSGGDSANNISASMKKCMSSKLTIDGSQVVYPSTGLANQYTFTISPKKEMIDAEVASGDIHRKGQAVEASIGHRL